MQVLINEQKLIKKLEKAKASKQVLFITHKYPPSMGGMQKESYELVTGIEKLIPSKKIAWHNMLTA